MEAVFQGTNISKTGSKWQSQNPSKGWKTQNCSKRIKQRQLLLPENAGETDRVSQLHNSSFEHQLCLLLFLPHFLHPAN